MKIIVEVDPEEIANEINEYIGSCDQCGQGVETAESVSTWIVENDPNEIMKMALFFAISSEYEDG